MRSRPFAFCVKPAAQCHALPHLAYASAQTPGPAGGNMPSRLACHMLCRFAKPTQPYLRKYAMHKDTVQGICKQAGGMLREYWCRLIGDEAGIGVARNAQLAGSMQLRLARRKQESERQLSDFRRSHRNWDISKRLSQPFTSKETT